MPELKPIVDPAEASRRIAEKKGFIPKQEAAQPQQVEQQAPKQEAPKQEPVKQVQQQAQPVKQEQPKAEPKSNPFDIEAFNKTFGTQHKSPDEIKGYFDADKKYKETDSKYQELNKKYTDLELKSKTSPFADPFVEKLNEMKKSGASKDQIKAFVKLNEIGDIASLDVKDRAILKSQLSEGLTEREATRLFNKDYKLDISQYPDLDEAEALERIEDEKIRLKRDSKGIDSFLSDYVKEVSTVRNPEQEFSSKWKEIEPKVKDIAPVIAESYEGIKMNLNGKKGDDAIEFAFQVPDEFRKEIPNIVEQYHLSEFAQGRPVPMTQEGLQRTKEYISTVLKAQYFDKFMLDAANHAESVTTERMANKYSNSGRKAAGDQPPVQNEPIDTRSQYKQNVLRPRSAGITMS